MSQDSLGIAVIGAGMIGRAHCAGYRTASQMYGLDLPEIRLVAVADAYEPFATDAATRFGYVANELHRPVVEALLAAGKHVICEKPLAMTVAQADELLALARSRDLLCIANLMQRYNPLFHAVARLVESRVLGECLHGWFENYASDEGLNAEHWFWDREKSGGIFVEHGVHFFDLFEGWLGSGEVVAAQRALRPGSGIEEIVQCTVRHASGPLVNFHHGFTQPSRLDRQEFRLLFEHGDVTLEEWVPVRARIRGVVNEEQTRTLMELFPGSRLDVLKTYGGRDRIARGRFKDLDIYQQIELHHDPGGDKMRRYCELLRDLFTDQLAWLRDRSHARKITERNGRDSLAMAEAATGLAMVSP